MSNPIEQLAAPWCNQCYTYHEGTGCPSYWEPGPAAKVPVRHIGDMKRRIAELEAENAGLQQRAAPSLSERIEALTQEQCLEIAWLGMTERLKDNPVATIKAVRSALRRLLGEQ